MTDRYDMIFKRKSVRNYDEGFTLSEKELDGITAETKKLIPLCPEIKVVFELVPRKETSAVRGEYCLLMYSETKAGYLVNAGYMLQQLDLYLASENIGACWYGIAKPKADKTKDGLSYVVMFSLGKSRPTDFRTDVSQFLRSGREAIWQGDFDPAVTEAVRLAPSACNSQPWRITSGDGKITVFRKTNIVTAIPITKMDHYNTIDMGICLCHLETALSHVGIGFERTFFPSGEKNGSLIKIAEYRLK